MYHETYLYKIYSDCCILSSGWHPLFMCLDYIKYYIGNVLKKYLTL